MKPFVLISEEKLAAITSEPIQKRISENSFIINAYEIDELEYDCKKLALYHYQNILITDDWYEDIYEEADDIGVKITGFSIATRTIEIVLQYSFIETCNLVFEKYMAEAQIYKDCVEAIAVYSSTENEDQKQYYTSLLENDIKSYYLDSLINKFYSLKKDENIEKELKRLHYLFNIDGTKFFTNETT